MPELIFVLIPIALLDSTSIIPLCIVVLVMLLAGPNPVARSAAHILGVYLVYFACGLLIMLGLQSAFDQINTYALRLWKFPETGELIGQILIGGLLLAFGLRIARGSEAQAEKALTGSMTALQALIAGGGLTIVGFPGAVPYFAAIDLALRADVSLQERILALGIYNLFFVLPLGLVVMLRLVLGERSKAPLEAVKGFFDRWGQRVIVVLFMVLGAVLLVDGIGWLLGYPLIPV